MMTDLRIGLVGLGVMGRNLALNIAGKGFPVIAYDPWAEVRTKFAEDITQGATERITVVETQADLIAALPTPRVILIMVAAGQVVDQVIDGLIPLLNPGDILIDGGNSHYPDTMRREECLRERGLYFIGLGVSGGEEGARNGPSLMAGGSLEAYSIIRPVLEAIAARFDGEPCCARVGSDGAGHFIKMIHNGIEYGVMQLIAETYVLLRDAVQLDHPAMAAVFRRWNETELSSYLVEITTAILEKEDDLAKGPLVEKILDTAGQKGTGRWSSEAALKFGIPTPTITEAVFARSLASLRDQRIVTAKILSGPVTSSVAVEQEAFVEALRQALLSATVATYAQGLAVIDAAGKECNWSIDLGAVSSIWRAGCIIRAHLLDEIKSAYETSEKPVNLMCAPAFAKLLAETQSGWRQTVEIAVRRGIPIPGLSSALAYYDGYRSPSLWSNMIQAQRDCFGAHTYERNDRPGIFHSDWQNLD